MITLKVSFTDPTGRYDTVAQSIISNFNAAFDVYRPFLPPRAIQLEVDLKMVVDPDVYANGGSAAVAYVGDLDGLDLFLAGAAYELATGNDLNAGSADLTVNIGTKGFDTAMWIDPLDGRDAPDGRYSLGSVDKVDSQITR